MDHPHWPLEAPTPSSNGSIHTLDTSPLNIDEQSRPTRPRLVDRMAPPQVAPRRRGKSTPRPGSTFASLKPKREWSVFEQRMKNEGQMRTKNTLREPTSEGVGSSPFRKTVATRSESPAPGAPSLRHVVVEDGHDSDDASTVGYDSDSDSEDTSTPSTPISHPPPQKRRWYSKWKPSPLTPLQRNILKCAVAYFVGSLFTFNPTLSGLITSVTSTRGGGVPSQSGHMVATV
jgi:hypothetical protein